MKSKKWLPPSDHPFDLDRIEHALRRAGLAARDLAARTDTPLVLYEDGRIVFQPVEKTPPARAG